MGVVFLYPWPKSPSNLSQTFLEYIEYLVFHLNKQAKKPITREMSAGQIIS